MIGGCLGGILPLALWVSLTTRGDGYQPRGTWITGGCLFPFLAASALVGTLFTLPVIPPSLAGRCPFLVSGGEGACAGGGSVAGGALHARSWGVAPALSPRAFIPYPPQEGRQCPGRTTSRIHSFGLRPERHSGAGVDTTRLLEVRAPAPSRFALRLVGSGVSARSPEVPVSIGHGGACCAVLGWVCQAWCLSGGIPPLGLVCGHVTRC